MTTLHDKAIQHIVEISGGVDNHHHSEYWLMKEPTLEKKPSGFYPDVVKYEGKVHAPGAVVAIHEVEVAKTKMTKQFLKEYLAALKWDIPRHRPFMSLWIVIPNFKEMLKTFDEVKFLAESENKLIPLKLVRK